MSFPRRRESTPRRQECFAIVDARAQGVHGGHDSGRVHPDCVIPAKAGIHTTRRQECFAIVDARAQGVPGGHDSGRVHPGCVIPAKAGIHTPDDKSVLQLWMPAPKGCPAGMTAGADDKRWRFKKKTARLFCGICGQVRLDDGAATFGDGLGVAFHQAKRIEQDRALRQLTIQRVDRRCPRLQRTRKRKRIHS